MSKNKIALITGATGQDGAWLSKHLLDLGYTVYGAARRNSQPNQGRLEILGIKDKLKLVEFELSDQSNVNDVIREIKPDELYNLAAQSFVAASFKQPISTSQVDFMGVLYILDALRQFSKETKFYQASTSEMFGKVQEVPQKESTPFYPKSPYGVAKLASHWATINYRESYGLFACSGILFNHESELRGEEFVTRKISLHAATWAKGEGKVLELGNMSSKRDWGYAKEYVQGMHLMLQQKNPDTYILATGKTYTIREFVEAAYEVVGINIKWVGKDLDEQGIDKKTGKVIVKVNPQFFRPSEVDLLIGDASKAKKVLGWEAKTDMLSLAKLMVKFDVARK